MRITTAERYGLDINEIAEFMDDFGKSLVIDTNYIIVIDNETTEWVETFFPIKFKCRYCTETVADIEPSEMEFNPTCPVCKKEHYN